MRSSESLFRVPPFPAFPSVRRYVAVGTVDEAMQRLCRSIESRDGISLVMGPPGTGKSLLAQLVRDTFAESRQTVLLGEVPIESPAALYRQLLHRLGLDAAAEGEGHLALADHLRSGESSEAGLLLIVDEAQALSAEVLEAIRMVTNIIHHDEPRVTAVLFGGPRLEETLTSPALEPFAQRVATRCYLHPLTADETRRYVEESIRRCGAEPDETISDEAVAAVHHACGGIPRLINQLMTEAIDCAELAGQTMIGEGIIDQAWAKLQQLPSPIIEDPSLAARIAAGHPVEFGELDEPPTEAIAATTSQDAESSPEPAAALPKPKPSQVQPNRVSSETGELAAAENGKLESLPVALEATPDESTPVVEVSQGETEEPELEPDFVHATVEIERAGELDAMEIDPDDLDLDAIETIPATTGGSGLAQQPEPAAESISRSLLLAEAGDAEPLVASGGNDLPLGASIPPAPSSDVLFGDFDEEEDLSVCGKPRHAETLDSSIPLDEVAAIAKGLGLESMIHQEVIGIAANASDACGAASENSFTVDRDEAAAPIDGANESQDPETEASADRHPVLWLTEGDDGELVQDDTDLLIIEEDLPREKPFLPGPSAETERPVTIDFQQMLNRMRTG